MSPGGPMVKLLTKLLLVPFVLMPTGLIAQVATGTPTFNSFGGGPFDTVNLGNLNVYFNIPIVNKAGRGMPFIYNLAYNNSVWSPVIVNGTTTWTPAQAFGWTAQTAVATGYMSVSTVTSNQFHFRPYPQNSYTCSMTTDYNYVYHDPFGVQHPFNTETMQCSGPSQCNNPPNQPNATATATDGSGYQLSITRYISSLLTSTTGKQISPPYLSQSGAGTLTDTNGNQISSNGSGTFTDTLGTTALTIGGGAPNPETFSYTNPQGTQSTY